MALEPYLQLQELGSKLDTLPSSKDALITLLKQATTCLAELYQSPEASILVSIKPFFDAIVKPELLKHEDRDVKLLVASSLCEITRITAPEAPYSDDVLKDIFQLIVSTFSGLNDTSGPSFDQRVVILDTVAKYRSCVVMLDLECDDLVNDMFRTFFTVARDDHPESILTSMQTIMVVLLEESEDVHDDLLSILLSMLGREKRDVTAAARKLSMNVIQQCIGRLEPVIKQFLLSLMSGDSKPVDSPLKYHDIICDLYSCAPQILSGVLPYVTGELLADQLETRLKAVNLVGDLIALPGPSIPELFQPIFSEFLKRLTDGDLQVRMSVLEHVKSCLLSNPFRAEAPQIISALCDRLLDFDENFQKQIVAAICDVACHSLNAVPLETVKLVAERLHDKSFLVKKYTMERLAEIYRVFCEISSDTVNPNEYVWIPGKILRCFFDKDFRSEIIESVLCGSIFPSEFSINYMVKHWVEIFSGFDKVEVKALEKILEQKQGLQQEMQKYLTLRQMSQDKDNPEVQKKITFCFRVMSRSFADPTKAEESFQILAQLKDDNIWKILTNLVDPNASFHQTRAHWDDLLKIFGEKHQLYAFLNTFYVKCALLIFNKEHVKAVLSEIVAHKSAEDYQRIQSCMNILVIIARFSPFLLSGSEEELVNLLKDNNDMIKEGVLNVLAKAGGTIREELAVTSSSVDLMLERLCLEGSRTQAKYAVHALAAITKDDGLKSLSVLYKRLVDMLEERTHLPAVLQSLGCIAQTAMPVFETRESEIEEFIINKILKSDSKEDQTRASWDDKSDLCNLKIYGIKTLVKSYLPVKDAHVRPGIDGLLDILRNMLSFGEISKDLHSSSVDKAHLRLASAKAVLRLSRLWDHKIPADIFHLTLRTSEISFPQAKKVFLSKVHQYIKEHLLDAKYACAFVFNIFESKPEEFAKDKQNLAEIIQMHQQAKERQLSVQSDTNSLTTYPEYILPYLVHALANISCPNIDECKDVEAYNNIYRQLHLILSLLLQRDKDVNSEVDTYKEKEALSTITIIFQSIKHSEDMLDASMSKNSHAICDLGLAITKRLAQKDVDLQGLSSVSLPPILYKAREKDDDTVVGEVKTWLADESVLAHFESLILEMVPSQLAEVDALKDSEKDRNEVPLGKTIKNIKSQGTKGKKVKKKKSVPTETKKTENDIDVLNMVREINLDNLEMSANFESSNGHQHSLRKKLQKDPVCATNKKRNGNEETPSPVPKRKRSSLTHGKFRSSSTATGPRRFSAEKSPGAKSLVDAEINPDTDIKAIPRKTAKSLGDAKINPDTDIKAIPRKTVRGNDHSLKSNIKVSESYNKDDADKSDEHDLQSPDNLKSTDKTQSGNFKSCTGSSKKVKRKSIGGIVKCTEKEGDTDAEELIGCRIKIWWPLDKQFYEGSVESYDPLKRKHVILYYDGEVETLRLEKERWELIDHSHRPTKRIKPTKTLSSREASTGKKQKDSSGSASKRTTKIVNSKQSPNKHIKNGRKGASKSIFHQEETKESSDISVREEAVISEAEMNSGGSEGEQAESDEITVKEKKSNKKVKSVSRGKRAKKKQNLRYRQESDKEKQGSDEKQDSDEEKQDYGERHFDESESVPQGVQSDDEKNSSKERAVDESGGSLRENVNVEESGSEGNQNSSDDKSSPRKVKKSLDELTSSDGARVAEISDDEPLSKWKLPSGKKSSGKKR
ncbi:PREDICTED: sister chromatid cohesion protein PDS5 homolog A-A-like isoform X1 [Lupinus angustifolius]|uniref:sister chromatid cohesion protein PDS5 homolog A-A-like isoform X1 n=1 Tax=Lupinus angustifolius TaxID=3871 RepID=UPI00092E55B6|nr:PREDICTED: sister chromatid cohesion protein PDS5 homolog A-A-like isoform X1 [Lupinus angustifolius]